MAKNKLRPAFASDLLRWYDANKRDLPWRRSKDPYHILVSEIMLQQTTVKAVLEYYDRWLKRFPTVRSLAKADLQTVLKSWQGLGYYSRARNLHKAAQIISKDLDGKVPSSAEKLKELPGLGPYASAAVASIAFGERIPLIDANVRRVMQRIFAVKDPQKNFDHTTLEALQEIIPHENSGDFNQAMMELGALVCRSREPSCNMCSVRQHCKAYARGLQERIPQPKVSRIKHVEAVVAIIRQKEKILIQKRPSTGLLAGLWEFPGGKIEPSDRSLKGALKRELCEELGCAATIGKKRGTVAHFYTTFQVQLHVFEAVIKGSLPEKSTRQWATLWELQNTYPMPSASARIVQKFLLK